MALWGNVTSARTLDLLVHCCRYRYNSTVQAGYDVISCALLSSGHNHWQSLQSTLADPLPVILDPASLPPFLPLTLLTTFLGSHLKV